MPLVSQWQSAVSSADENIYHEQLVHPVMSLNKHENVLILGGGDGLALREVLKPYRREKSAAGRSESGDGS
jgi:predicted membrane-bound spermidine synthase